MSQVVIELPDFPCSFLWLQRGCSVARTLAFARFKAKSYCYHMYAHPSVCQDEIGTYLPTCEQYVHVRIGRLTRAWHVQQPLLSSIGLHAWSAYISSSKAGAVPFADKPTNALYSTAALKIEGRVSRFLCIGHILNCPHPLEVP
jgi:hypothetical protein